MTDAAKRYKALLAELLRERKFAGPLSEDEESRYAEMLDRYWWEMSADEQEEVERRL